MGYDNIFDELKAKYASVMIRDLPEERVVSFFLDTMPLKELSILTGRSTQSLSSLKTNFKNENIPIKGVTEKIGKPLMEFYSDVCDIPLDMELPKNSERAIYTSTNLLEVKQELRQLLDKINSETDLSFEKMRSNMTAISKKPLPKKKISKRKNN